MKKRRKHSKQVAAIPIARAEDGSPLVMVITSRQTTRFIVPKGWPVKGKPDHRSAEIEAREEVGVVGRAHPKPIGSYLAWKRRSASFELVKIKVYLLDIERHLDAWKEQGERSIAWLAPEDAAAIVDEPGLAQILMDLPGHLPKAWRTRVGRATGPNARLGRHPIIRTALSGSSQPKASA